MSFRPALNFSSIEAGVIGKLFARIPIACDIALATAAIGGTNGTSPTSCTPNGCPPLATSMTTVSIIGMSRLVGHPVIKETGVKHQAIAAGKILFVESPSDTLDSTALNLAFDIALVYCFACILKSGVPDDVHLTGLWIDLDVHDVKPKGIANPDWVSGSPADNCASSTIESTCNFL